MKTEESSLHDRVCEEIRVVMARRKLSQSEVARRAGWSVYYLNHRMLGKTPMNVNDLESLARVLGVEPTSFFPSGRSVSGGDINLRKCAQPVQIQPGCVTKRTLPARYGEDSPPFENGTLDTSHAVAA